MGEAKYAAEEGKGFIDNKSCLVRIAEKKLPDEWAPSFSFSRIEIIPEHRRGINKILNREPTGYEVVLATGFQRPNRGDVLLDFTSKEVIEVKSDNKYPALPLEKAKHDFILIRDGSRTEKKYSRIEGRMRSFEIKSYFVGLARIGGVVGKIDKKEASKALERQALVSVVTKDEAVLLPQTVNLGEMIISKPERLALYIIQNEIYKNSDEACGIYDNKISPKDIVWLVIHRSIQKTISRYPHSEIMELPQLASVRPEIQAEILTEIDLALSEIGISREPATIGVKIKQRVGNFRSENASFSVGDLKVDYERKDRPSDFDHSHVSITLGDKLAAGILAQQIAKELNKQANYRQITPEEILELNPDLQSSEHVHVPPVIKMLGFSALVESIYMDPENERYSDGSTDIRWWVNESVNKRKLNSPVDADKWWEHTYNKIQDGEFTELERKGKAALMIECLPIVVNWWKAMLKKSSKPTG